jgi:hypothetical protein
MICRAVLGLLVLPYIPAIPDIRFSAHRQNLPFIIARPNGRARPAVPALIRFRASRKNLRYIRRGSLLATVSRQIVEAHRSRLLSTAHLTSGEDLRQN